MSASLAHMLVAQDSLDQLRKDPALTELLTDVLDKYRTFMELGALGPDLPYFGSLLAAGWNIFVNRSDKPMAVDAWSYQMHSKRPNVFPLKLIEATWKEADFNIRKWEPQDRMKFSFLCGFLTHVATDQIIHPAVNRIAGSYYKRLTARDTHRECEIHQDVYAVAQHKGGTLTARAFCDEPFGSWCDTSPEVLDSSDAVWFRYFIQKAFIEAHGVSPEEKEIGAWISGIQNTLRWLVHPQVPFWGLVGPYGTAHKNLFDGEGKATPGTAQYKRYIKLMPDEGDKVPEEDGMPLPPEAQAKDYDDYFAEAVELATVYIKAADKVCQASELTDAVRKNFLRVVQNADLGAPLEHGILAKAKAALANWRTC